MENILAVDAVSSGISVAVIKNGELICDFTVDNKKTHSQGLMKLIDFALKMADLSISKLSKIITTNGPGSFTGLRILLSTVKGLAHIQNIPIYCVSSLTALSNHELFSDALICPIMDARRSQVYSAVYDKDGRECLRQDVRMIDELLKDLEKAAARGKKKVIFVGDAIFKYERLILSKSDSFMIGDLKHATNPALCAYRAYQKGQAVLTDYEVVEVNYLRIPEAQRNLESKCEESENKCSKQLQEGV